MEENIVRFVNVMPFGITWHTLVLCILTFVLYFFDVLEPLIKLITVKRLVSRKEDYYQMKKVDPIVSK